MSALSRIGLLVAHRPHRPVGKPRVGPELNLPCRNRGCILDMSNESCGLKITGEQPKIIINPEARESGERREHSPVQGRIDV